MEGALRVFNKMPSHDVVSWNVIISGRVKCGQGQQEGVEPSPVTFVGAQNAYASIFAIDEGRHDREQIILRGWESNSIVGTFLWLVCKMWEHGGGLESLQQDALS
jgi:hypothetical protein